MAMAPLKHKGRDALCGVTTFAHILGMSGSVLSHIGRLVEELGNRRVGEDLMSELIERHALSDRQTADGDDLRGWISIDLHPEDLLSLGVAENLEEPGGALILGYLVHDRRLRPDGIDRDCLSLYVNEVEELLYGVDFIDTNTSLRATLKPAKYAVTTCDSESGSSFMTPLIVFPSIQMC